MAKKKKHKILLIVLCITSVLVLGVVFGIAVYATSNVDFDNDEKLFEASKEENITRFYYDASGNYGKKLDEYVPVEFECLSGAVNKMKWCKYSDIPNVLKNAFIATEDRRFFEHHGINFKRTLGAMFNYIIRSDNNYGGSTITQQVIKNISGDNERTAKRKINEIIRAYHLEYSHSKEEIFELYMNIIPLGEGVAGVSLASEVYFNKLPTELNTEESATIVALTNAPGRYNPYKNYDACLEKRNTVIASMYECGYIDEAEFKRATASPIILNNRVDSGIDVSSWYVETVCNELCADIMERYGYSKDTARIYIQRGGLSVYTTMDYNAQQIIDRYFEDKNNFPSDIENGLNYSFVLCDSESADLRAIEGGVGKKAENRILNFACVKRPPASTLKPLALYAPLIDSGRITWATVFDDVPVKFNVDSTGEYSVYPQNSPQVYDGLIPVSEALANSKNTVAIRLLYLLGVKNAFKGLSDRFDFGKYLLSDKDMSESPLALGQLTNGIPLRALTEAYTSFSADGVLYSGRSYVLCKDRSGKSVIEKGSDGERVFSAECARIMNQLLMGVVEHGTARRITLKDIVDVAGKTGTSGASRDRLFVGYTPYFVGGIWSGYSNSDKSVGVYSQNQIKVWDDIMKLIHENHIGRGEHVKTFSTRGLVRASFCVDSGKCFSPKCIKDPRGSRISYGYFKRGSEPQGECDRHVLCDYDIFLRGVAVNPTFVGFIKEIALLDIPERSFPTQVYITDAEYTWRNMSEINTFGDSHDVPYYIYAIPDGEYVGISKSKKQFNSSNIYRR